MTIDQLVAVPIQRAQAEIITPPSKITEAVTNARSYYAQAIKPLIAAGDYAGAVRELEHNTLLAFDVFGQDIERYIHKGYSFMHHGRLLRNALAAANETDIPQRMREFEAYAAQTKLPLAR